MPIVPQPNRIEVSDLTGGYNPDSPEAGVPINQLPDVLNFLPNPSTKYLEMRKGFWRLGPAAQMDDNAGYFIRHLNYYELILHGSRERFLVAVVTSNNGTAADNVQVWVYDLQYDTWERVDTVGRTWANPQTEHWYAVVEGTYYGGTRGEVMYSWHPDDGWDADPSTPDVKTWVDDRNDSVDTTTEFGRDYAFKNGQLVLYSNKYYSTLTDIRYDPWESGQRYKKGDMVSYKATWASSSSYWKSFECVTSHVASGANDPKTDDQTTYWKLKRLANIKDSDGDLTDDWAYMPLPGKSSVAVYHGFRLWLRHDDSDNWARLQYSAPAKPEKDALISDLDWNPKDWAPVDDEQGDGGGWFTVPFRKGDAIRALYSYGSYLIIFGRWETFVLSGTNEQTWTLRKLGNVGAIASHSVTELDGLVYFASPEGRLYVTDATSVQAIPGGESVQEYIKNRIDLLMVGEDDFNYHPQLTAYAKKLWLALPDEDSGGISVVYDPATQSFWPLDFPILSMAVGAQGRAERLWCGETITRDEIASHDFFPTIFQYMDDPGDEVWTDDSSQRVDAPDEDNPGENVNFRARSAWFQFGTTRNERRIRKVWTLFGEVEDSQLVVVYTYRNFGTTWETEVTRTMGTGRESYWAEGMHQPDSYAVGVGVAGDADSDVALIGFGVDTEPRRTRFHRGDGS